MALYLIQHDNGLLFMYLADYAMDDSKIKGGLFNTQKYWYVDYRLQIATMTSKIKWITDALN